MAPIAPARRRPGARLGEGVRRWLALLLALTVAGAQPAPAGEDAERLLARRHGYLLLWEELGRPGVGGVERFGALVQHVVDDTYRRYAARGDDWLESDADHALLDDLVDIMVGAEYQREKDLVMLSPSVVRGPVIVESAADLASFAPRFRAGDGRLRHFAMNAAAAYVAPPLLVDLLARRVGGDEGDAPSGDSAADLATNEVGRAFAQLLRERPLAELADGERVAAWIEARFAGEP